MGAFERWQGFSPIYGRNRLTLFWFELWNLVVILVSLVGFNHVSWLACWPWSRWVLWFVALGTVIVTFACVVVWTGEGRWFSERLRNRWNRLRKRLGL